jgi:hypothetical protein
MAKELPKIGINAKVYPADLAAIKERGIGISSLVCELLHDHVAKITTNDFSGLMKLAEEESDEIERRENKRLSYIKMMGEHLKKTREKNREKEKKELAEFEKNIVIKSVTHIAMEKDIKEKGLESIEKEMLEEFEKNQEIINDDKIMESWKKRFKEKCPDFLWGRELAYYCIYKHRKKKMEK